MRVSSPSDQALIQAQWRLETPGRRAAVAPATPGAEAPDRSTVPEVRVYEGEYVPGDTARGGGSQTFSYARHGAYDSTVGYGQADTGARRGPPPGVLRYLEQQPAEPSPVGPGPVGRHIDVYV